MLYIIHLATESKLSAALSGSFPVTDCKCYVICYMLDICFENVLYVYSYRVAICTIMQVVAVLAQPCYSVDGLWRRKAMVKIVDARWLACTTTDDTYRRAM